MVSDSEIGIGGTTAWKMNGLGPRSTAGFYFEPSAANATNVTSDPYGQNQQYAFIQFVTSYQHSSGTLRLRVTTLARQMTFDMNAIKASFDQEAAAVLMARLAVFKVQESVVPNEILRWIDRNLIKLCTAVADYRKDDINSFRLSPVYSLYPQFMSI